MFRTLNTQYNDVAQRSQSEQIVFTFFVICGTVLLVALLIMGITFLVASLKGIKNPDLDDPEYLAYLKKGYILRFCYGYCVAADTLLTGVEIAATATGAFIALIPDTPSSLVAILLIATFAASSLRSALNLKHGRAAYAKAFRKIEFATDDYRVSNHDSEAKQKLHEANEVAQKIIEDLVE